MFTARKETAMTGHPQSEAIAIRRAFPDDRATLERLAALDSAPVPAGDVLIAEVDDEPWAAIAVGSDAAVADPFRPTADLVELLRLRAAGLRRPAESRRPLRLRFRSAYRTA
jgi:hypothetical protein